MDENAGFADTPIMRRRHSRESGQAAVETAIVMPLFLFIFLGLLQLGLAHQARLLTRYAAYKATRAGAIHRANKKVMTNAALGVLVPITATVGDGLMRKAGSIGDYAGAWAVTQLNLQDMAIPIVETTICNPTSDQINADSDFDDPRVASAAAGDWKGFQRTRLHVQTTFYYRLVIPFANGILFWAAAGVDGSRKETFSTLRLQSKNHDDSMDKWNGKRGRLAKVLAAAEGGKYYLPIRANYAMRLQSNVKAGELPAQNQCFVNFQKESGPGSAERRRISSHSKSGTSQ
jgi:hypothetical protein